MGKNAKNLGKSVGNSLGYNIRMIVTGKTDEKTKKTYKVHNGKFGIYAGKNKIEEVENIPQGMDRIKEIVNKRILK